MTDYVAERIRPEALINVPEESFVESYQGSLGRVAVFLSPYRGFPTYEYDIGAVHRDVRMGNTDIGYLNLKYDYQERKVRISSVRLEEYRGNGVGIALYRTILQLPLPSGESPRGHGFMLESSGQSEDARRVWRRLVDTGEATQSSKNHFTMR